MIDKNKVVKPNDAMDLFHAIVPVAYCDFVLLDAQWEHRVTVIRERLIKHNIEIVPAEVYSEKLEGIERFFENLENSKK